MRFAAGLMAISLASGAWAAEPASPRPAWMERELMLAEAESRATALYPRRRDAPLRYLNMTDAEVREVQIIARKYDMPEILNISPVVEGCDCAEGGDCTEQVYITSRVGDHTAGLQLSRKKNLWTVGTVQKWWLEYTALKARERNMTYRDFRLAREGLLTRFPMCSKPADAAAAAPAKVVEARPAK